MQSNNIDIVDAIELFGKKISKTINCVKIGKIESFHALTQTVDVQLTDKIILKEDDQEHIFDYPLLTNRPLFILGGGKSTIQMPISKGDVCIVLFNDRDMDNFLTTGTGEITKQVRSHHLTDAMVLVGIHSYTKPISNYTTDGIVIESDRIKLGAMATKGVARKGDTVTITKAQWTAANPQTSQGPVTISNDLQFTITSGSSKVKAE